MNAEEISRIYLAVAKLAFVPPSHGKIVVHCDEQEEIAFHLMHLKFKKESDYRTKNLLDERYPFVKIDDRWFLSIPKLYLYLFGARRVIAQSEHETMVTLYKATQRASRYYDEYKALDEKLTPHGHLDYPEYQMLQADLYKNYCYDQLELLELEDGWRKNYPQASNTGVTFEVPQLVERETG